MSNPYQHLQLPHSPLPAPLPSNASNQAMPGSQQMPMTFDPAQMQQAQQQQQIETALSQLSDIHLPPAVQFWPPAPGWWIAIFLTFLIGYFLIRFSIRKIRQIRYARQIKNQVNTELEHINRHWQKQQNIVLTSAKLSQLLRRYALFVFQRKKVAGISHYELLQYLEEQFKLTNFTQKYHLLFDELAYQDPMIMFDMKEKEKLSQQINEFIPLLKKMMTKGLKLKKKNAKESSGV